MRHLPRATRNRPAVCAALFCSAALLAALTACSTQDARQSVRDAERDLRKTLNKLADKPQQSPEPALPPAPIVPPAPPKITKPVIHAIAEPEPEPTQQELVEYLRGKLLALSPGDGVNDNVDVRFDPATSTLTVSQPNSRCDHFLSALDAGNVSWDAFDPSDSHASRDELLRLTVTSVSGKAARACFDEKGQPEEGVSTNRVRLLFSRAKSEEIPGFREQMAKVVKKLIILSGGVEGKEVYSEPHPKPHSSSGSGNK